MVNSHKFFLGAAIFIFFFAGGYAQIDSVIVERYYVAGVDDTLDFALADPLKSNSVTYRIYIDLSEGSKLLEIFGSENHPFIISAGEPFFNNTFRGQSFGYRNNVRSFAFNTAALDSWLTLGMVTREYLGILKESDPDGSIPDIKDNVDSVLNNEDPSAGIPLRVSDGMIKSDIIYDFTSIGVTDITGTDSTIFGQYYLDTLFYSENFFIRENSGTGIFGPTEDNQVLIGQLTTNGEISFTLNITVEDINGDVFKYFGKDSLINDDENERFSVWLKYPFELISGCTDPNYAEYNSKAVIDDGSCQEAVVFGCMNMDACNYNPGANVHLEELCCYNAECDLNLEEVCPGIIYGCMDPEAANYNPEANTSPDYDICCYNKGCMDNRYLEYNRNACYQDSTDCRVLIVEGCVDKSACNYNPVANRTVLGACDYTSCLDQSGTKSFSLTGRQEKGTYDYLVYPNPVEGILYLELNLSDPAMISYEIWNLLGRQVKNSSRVKLETGNHTLNMDFNSLVRGFYFVKLKVNDSVSIQKILKY
jgi:hypothetical protein